MPPPLPKPLHVANCLKCAASLNLGQEPKYPKVRCPRCAQLVDVPQAQPLPPFSPLTPCSACNKRIAKEAATCPQCGAPNKWFHPEIQRFYALLRTFDFAPSIEFQHEKFVLVGVDHGANKNERSLANLMNSFGMIGSAADVLSFHFAREWVNRWASKNRKAFHVDFHYGPPAWSSTDDEYWLDVMYFFCVPRLRKKRRKPS